MKKNINRTCFVVAVFVLLQLAAVSFCLSESARQEELYLRDGIHKSSDNYPEYFEYVSADVGYAAVNIAQNVFEAESADTISRTIEDDIEKIMSTLDLSPSKCEIFVVKKINDAGMEVFDSRVYVTTNEVLTGNYRKKLSRALYNIDEWQAVGLVSYVYNDAINDQLIHEYFSNSDSIDILSLSYPYFSKDFNTEYEISVAAETSKALFKFAVDNGLGFSNTIELRRQWLESIGINREFEAAYPSIADYAFYSTHRYPIIAVSSRKDEFYFKPVEGILETSQSVLEFLESTTCFEEILSYIAENAPNVSGAVMENYSEPIKAYFGRVSKHTRGDIKFRTIDLMYPSDYLHETIHVMLNTRIGTEILWSHEGIINWLLHKHNYPSDLRDRLNKMYSISESGLVSIGADLAQYIRLTNTIYDTKQNDLEEDNFNLFNYKEALLDASLILPISRELLPKMLTDTISDIYLTGLDRLLISPGMELSDVEAIHFIDYLIDKYSFETVLEFCLNQSPDYEAVFGLTYRELRADYLDYLTEETEGAGGMMD